MSESKKRRGLAKVASPGRRSLANDKIINVSVMRDLIATAELDTNGPLGALQTFQGFSKKYFFDDRGYNCMEHLAAVRSRLRIPTCFPPTNNILR